MTITTDGIEKWNLETLDTVFEIATERSARKADFGGALGDADNGLKDWEGHGGDAFRRELGRHRADINDHQSEATAIANAFYAARAEVAACKVEWSSIKSAAASNDWGISPDGRLSGHVTAIKRNDFDALQRRLTKLMSDAGRTDQDLATAIRAVVGDTKVTADGRAIFGPPLPADAAKAPAGRAPATGARTPGDASGDAAAGSLPWLLNQTRQGGGPIPPVPLNPKDVESFKVAARQVLTNDGVPPDQIEARINAAVLAAQQPLPRYVPPAPQRGPAPGFGDGVGDRWRATEQGVKNLLGQGGPGAPGVLESWGEMAKGVGSAMINPVGAGVAEVKEALEAPSLAYYLGEKTFDVGSAAVTLPFAGEGAMVRAGLPAEVLTEGGAPAAVLRDWHPTGGMSSAEFESRFGAPESRVWPGNDGFPSGYVPQPAQLPDGTIIDRFGSAGGRYLAPDGTPFADRSLAPELVDGNYNRYMVTGEPLPPGWQIVEGPVEPFYGQAPSPGATQYMITAPDGVRPTVRELVKLGILDSYGPPLGR
ncbi:glycohydrolase toxin TNT-related protein [Mycobacterium sp. CSUR Q5927]|nr:glycohydrolase toxin TNT-related protein [Mycobacterium sp. CSUR Q5927]